MKQSYLFSTTVFWGSKDGTFQAKPLPAAAQVSPVYAISINDFDKDGKKDILMGEIYLALIRSLGARRQLRNAAIGNR